MIIQCPQCKSRYRSKALDAGQAAVKITCPKCTHIFLVEPETGAQEKTIKTTILLVDDALFFRELLVDLLKGQNAHLLTAESAEAAWEKLQQQQIDLLIVDINLPEKNGLELIQDIRADQRLRAIKILCISGVHRKEEDARRAMRAGADDFISKSFKPDELNARIEKLLQQ